MSHALAFVMGIVASYIVLRLFARLVIYRRVDQLTAVALGRCERETGQRGLCDGCALRLAKAAYNHGVLNKTASIRAAEARVASNARAYWMKHILRLKKDN